MLLARDRYGMKPMYIAERGDTVLFGSEVKALLAHPALTAQLDLLALREYLTFQNLFTERTLFAGVQLLPPPRTCAASAAGANRRRATGTSSSRKTGDSGRR